ncbi:DNA polymerase III subunit delta' [Demequina sp. TTPB684]|uniref:DNA polymerase III subunit delta' n=1 Tax=unclassified Demequina TaxID=2620311 RepID=UPI001CF1C9AD|nr:MULTISPECIES: DNA polymerase III subunit delta' [unclassified Demequina]MCB2413126.1 DNA polymerase III subunit delta' [Demequina sp. TTPB684]UPU89738.1 DNA polymerase III subunit delta' [Demequina sp. TMPB413]
MQAPTAQSSVALPGVWAEVVGQDTQIAPLRAAVERPGAMTHAWLITGPPGSGRSHAARAFAAALQCTSGGCGECKACKTALSAAHADVTLLATEKVTIGIDEVRDLSMLAQRAPSEGRWRVIIIEDADRMTERTSNVLLKAIEEPPPRTVWLLCAPHAHDVSVTIRSRCRVVALRTPPADIVARLLVERDGVEPGLAHESALAAQSHIGIARRLARDPKARSRRDQVLALATEVRGVGDAVLAAADLVQVAEDDAAAATQERDAHEKAELLAVLGAETGTIPPALRAQVRELEEDQKRRATRHKRDVLDRAMTDLMSLYRDVAAVQLGAATELNNVAHEGRIRELAARTDLPGTMARIDALGIARERLASNVQPLLAIEAMILALRPRA